MRVEEEEVWGGTIWRCIYTAPPSSTTVCYEILLEGRRRREGGGSVDILTLQCYDTLVKRKGEEG